MTTRRIIRFAAVAVVLVCAAVKASAAGYAAPVTWPELASASWAAVAGTMCVLTLMAVAVAGGGRRPRT